MLSAFLAALRFLTIFPIPDSSDNHTSLATTLPFFPVVGLVIGLLASTLVFFIWNILPHQVSAVLVVCFLVAVSGGLHMDGLADTADGFFSSRSRESILDIMRDSRIGAMGVMAIVFILALKISALGTMERNAAMRTVLLMPVAGRTSILLLMTVLDYVRPEGGLATSFYASSKIKVPAFFALIVLILLVFGCTGHKGAFLLLTVIAGSLLIFSRICRKKIGGATGDTLGAGSELTETVVAVMLSL